MDELTRRTLLQKSAILGTMTTIASAPVFAAVSGQESPRPPAGAQEDAVQRAIQAAADIAGDCNWSEDEERDRERALAADFTDDEAICWLLLNRASAKFLCLREQHPAERSELSTMIHELQLRLMSRPTYRKYREAMRSGGQKKDG